MDTVEIIGFHAPEDKFGCFSNWYLSPFLYASRAYVCSEQYMMFQKVRMGGRFDLSEKIMQTRDQSEMKRLAGPECYPEFAAVSSVWDRNKRHIAKRAVRAKFRQNRMLLEELLGTGSALLCEAAGSDRVWGVGINIADKAWKDPSNWKGENLLGRILMEVREELREEIARSGRCDYIDHRDDAPIPEWRVPAGTLRRIPQYYNVLAAYAEQIPAGAQRDAFYAMTLEEAEQAFNANSGAVPVAGFQDLKQDVYETACWLHAIAGTAFPREYGY